MPQIKITQEVEMSTLYDLLVTGFECGPPYSSFEIEDGSWSHGWRDADAGVKNSFAHITFLDRYEVEEGVPDLKRFQVTDEWLIAGFQKMAELYPQRAADAIEDTGNCDAIDGDVFLQICAFGEVVYG